LTTFCFFPTLFPTVLSSRMQKSPLGQLAPNSASQAFGMVSLPSQD